MKAVFNICILVIGLALGCRNKEPEAKEKHGASNPAAAASAQAAHADEAEHKGLPTRVRLDPAVVVDAQIRTASVVRELLAPTIDLPGEVSSDPDKTARVSALVPGRIETVSLKEGQTVKKGDVLIVIKVPELG